MNIKQLLREIHATGMTDEEIGSRIGTSQSIVFRLRTGVHKSTSFERGNRIQQLHTELVNAEGAPQEASVVDQQ
jgi:hypothetical protein